MLALGLGREVPHIPSSSSLWFQSLPREAFPLSLSIVFTPSTSHNADKERKESIGTVPTAEKRKLVFIFIFDSYCVLRWLPGERPPFTIHERISWQYLRSEYKCFTVLNLLALF